MSDRTPNSSDASDGAAALSVRGVRSGYGTRMVISDLSLEVPRGEIVALIGHNGAGKSTLLKAIFGLIPLSGGELYVDGRRVELASPRLLLSLGVGYVPQGHRVFEPLSVEDNLALGSTISRDNESTHRRREQVFSRFPNLKVRSHQRASELSGGEKQMLALANALVNTPRVLLLDEPTMGLSPAVAGETLKTIESASREHQLSVLIVEQKVRKVLEIARRVYVLRNGAVVFSGWARDLRDDGRLQSVYL